MPLAPALAYDTYLVKQHFGVFKAARQYDLYDPRTGQIVLRSREPQLGAFTKLFRFTDYRRATPFDAHVLDARDVRVLRIQRGVSLFLSRVVVRDANEHVIGGFQQRMWSIGGRFDIQDANGAVLCTLSGNWVGWDFQFKQGERVLGRATKKWAGIGKELFTAADNYVLQIDASVGRDDPVRPLMLAAVLVIDLVLKS